ncbi:hypothetical protein BKA67DRAFT_692700 [Truncatella angustata]|uniref:Uncharacterized protein n=1 Tax=Truncatella angustata TaxID=152316 RepID=A0A9P8ZY26_9PEZI|nr:uncharacterized protein BKA67DRAFT_692700 [Truncatella angustata]KAH6653599.1 hypothetical protein BKA67DRAFT_692700 [Truncatella angustata]
MADCMPIERNRSSSLFPETSANDWKWRHFPKDTQQYFTEEQFHFVGQINNDLDQYAIMSCDEPYSLSDQNVSEPFWPIPSFFLPEFRIQAVLGLLRHGRRLGELYRKHPMYPHVDAQIETMMLVDDISTSPEHVRKEFTQYMVQAGFLVDPVIDSDIILLDVMNIEQELVRRAWQCMDITLEDCSLIIMLRELLVKSGGRTDSWIKGKHYDTWSTPAMRLAILRSAIGICGSIEGRELDRSNRLCYLQYCRVFRDDWTVRAIDNRDKDLRDLLVQTTDVDLPLVVLLDHDWTKYLDFKRLLLVNIQEELYDAELYVAWRAGFEPSIAYNFLRSGPGTDLFCTQPHKLGILTISMLMEQIDERVIRRHLGARVQTPYNTLESFREDNPKREVVMDDPVH